MPNKITLCPHHHCPPIKRNKRNPVPHFFQGFAPKPRRFFRLSVQSDFAVTANKSVGVII
jgi:hypothetical protein